MPIAARRRLVDRAGSTAQTRGDWEQKWIATGRDSSLHALCVSVATEVRAMGAIPVFASIPTPLERQVDDVARLIAIAGSAGMVTIDLNDVYRGHNEYELVLNEYDRHPNVEGNRVIANALYDALVRRPELLAADARAQRSPK